MNRKEVARADGHGDIWLQAVAAASQDADVFCGKVEDMTKQIATALELHNEAGVPIRRLVTLWRNERWRPMITQWCSTTVGRASFRMSTWDWMISCRIDDVSVKGGGRRAEGGGRRWRQDLLANDAGITVLVLGVSARAGYTGGAPWRRA